MATVKPGPSKSGTALTPTAAAPASRPRPCIRSQAACASTIPSC